MKLWEIEPKSKLILKISINGQSIDLPTTVVSAESDGVITEAVRVKGKVISLNSENISVEVMLIQDKKSPMVWKGVACDSIVYNSKVHYYISSKTEGAEKNRREAFRLFVGNSGVAQIGTNKKALEVIVKDVSENGFSFVTATDIEPIIGTPTRVVFNDLDKQFSLMGIVVRKVVIDDNKILYGCKLGTENANLSRYIIEKQRQMMSMNKNNSAYKTKQLLEKALTEKSVSPDVLSDKSRIKSYGNNKRPLNTVEKEERREVFKDIHVGKKV